MLKALANGPFFLHEVVALLDVGQAKCVIGYNMKKGFDRTIVINNIGQLGVPQDGFHSAGLLSHDENQVNFIVHRTEKNPKG